MKKLIIGILITAVFLSLAIYIFFLWAQGRRESSTEAVIAVPVDASLLLKINNYHRFSEYLRSNNHLWGSVKQFTAVAKVDSTIAFVDTLTNRFSAFNLLLTVNPVYISTHVGKNGSYEFLAAVKIPKSASKKDLIHLVDGLTNNCTKIVEHKFEDVTINTLISINRSSEILSFAIFRGLVICSSSKSLIEISLHQIKNQSSLVTDQSFVAISRTAGTKVDANLFVNNKRLPIAFKRFFKYPYSFKIGTLTDIALWSELDISLKEDEIFLNGFTQSADSSNCFLKVLTHQKPIEIKIASILPAETATFICLGISDLDKYLEDYRSYLGKKDQILSYTSTLSDFKNALGVDIHELYRSFFNKEIALAYVAFDGIDYNDCWFVVVKTRSKSQAKQTFIDVLNSFAKSNKLKQSDFKTTLKIDKEKSVDIFRLPFKGINYSLLGSIFSGVSDEYFTFIDDYIIFGASKEALSKIILSNIHNNQLQLDISYRQFSNVLATASNYFFYLKPRNSEKLFSNLLDTQYSSTLSSNRSALNKIQGIALQLNGGSNMIFNNISFQYSPYTAEDPQTAWETRLDTAFTMKPQLVINHISKNQEIVVQDVKNKLYLINDVGRILWTKQLPEPIIGEIAQVDLFRNRKLQFIFNTKSFLFAIDRRGYFVDGYPVKLKSKATNPVAIFDYDGSRDYRLFIACEDLKIYPFNSSGKLVAGWSFRKTERPVTNQLQHFRVKGKDYIVFADKNRSYIVDRKGEERVSFSRFFSKSVNSHFSIEEGTKNSSERIITTDSVGLIKLISLNGKVEDIAIKAFSSKHVFEYLDIDCDGQNEFIFLDKSQLYVYKQNKSLLFLYKFDAEIEPRILNVNLTKSLHMLGFTSSSSRKIYLIDGKGSLYDGFPLKGSTPFSVSKIFSTGASYNVFTGFSSGKLVNYSIK